MSLQDLLDVTISATNNPLVCFHSAMDGMFIENYADTTIKYQKYINILLQHAI